MHTSEKNNDASSPWPRCALADHLFSELFTKFTLANPLLANLEIRFLSTAGVRLQTLIDHWILPPDDALARKLAEAGLEERITEEGDVVWKHEKARLPELRFKAKRTTPCLALMVEDIALFASANGLDLSFKHGDDDSQYECAHLDLSFGELMVIARRGYSGYAPGHLSSELRSSLTEIRKVFRSRLRFGDEKHVIAETLRLFNFAADQIWRDRAVDEFFSAERDYYVSRNTAACYGSMNSN